MLHLRAADLAATTAVAEAVANLARDGDVILLAGEMGAGKTAFAKAFGSALGIIEPITSPTFTLVHSYDGGRLALHHADVYRLTTNNELADLGLNELIEFGGVLLVEWGDVVARSFGEHLALKLEPVPDADNVRLITVSRTGKVWGDRWAQLERAVVAFTDG